MNNRHRHLRYKKSVYARRRLRVILITTACVVAVLLLLFLIIGNLLNRKVEDDKSEDASSTPPASVGSVTPTRPRSIHGSPVYLVNTDGSPLSSLNSQYSSLDPALYALTLPLDRADGTLLYRSSVAKALGTRPVLSGANSLDGMLETPKERGFYISASLTLSECKEEDPLIRSAKLSAVASVVCEAVRAGANDVLLLAPSATPEQLSELEALADTVHALLPEAVVGLSLSDAILQADDRDKIIETLSLSFNYLALDLSTPDGDDPVTYVAGHISGTSDGTPAMLFYLLRYEMRVILPPTEGEDYQSLLSILDRNSIQSWQIGYQ